MSANFTADHDLAIHLDQLQFRSLIAGGAGLVLCLLVWAISPATFYPAYLVGYLFWLGIALGSSGLTMLHHLTGGSWGLVIRRPLQAGAATILPMAVLFLPIALGLSTLYPWARVASSATELESTPYLNQPSFIIRAGVYFVFWIVLAQLLSRWSDQQDLTTDRTLSQRLQTMSGPGTVLLFLAGTFSAIDWGMSLEPRWTSTIYAPMIIVGDALATLATMIVVAFLLASKRPMSEIATPGRLHDLGNLLLAFVMLWAYMSFCQFLIIWAGNLSEEIPWYVRRTRGGWEWVALALIVFHFFLPFFVLLMRDNKRQGKFLSRVAAWILFMHWVDLVWLVVPASTNPVSPRILWGEVFVSVAAIVGIGGVSMWFFIGRLKCRPLVPLNDPNLVQALEHAGG
jgi:hypothetical protein